MSRSLVLALALTTTALRVPASEFSDHPRLPVDERAVAQDAADDFAAGRYNAAAAQYQSIITKYPDSLYAWSNLGVVRLQQGHLEQAKDAFDHALKLQPSDVFCQINLGIVYAQMNRYDKACDQLKLAVKAHPESAFAHEYLAYVYQKLGCKSDATRESETAAEIRRDHDFQPPVGHMYSPITDLPDGR